MAEGTIIKSPAWLAPRKGIDPYAITERSLRDLQDYYRSEEKKLRSYRLDPGTHTKIIAGLQEEYDQAKFKITSIQSQLNDIKRGIAAGQIDPVLGQEAMMRLVVPQETAEAMFPKEQRGPIPSATGISPSNIKSYVERFDLIRPEMMGYPHGKKWYRWDRGEVAPNKMVEFYFQERNVANLNDPRNANKIAGFNQAFIESMGKDERAKKTLKELLNPKTGDPRMIAAFSPDSSINRAFMNQFGTTKKASVSPFAATIQKQMPKQTSQRVRVISPQGVTGTVEADELEQYLAQGFKRIQ
jgi:hypothetical protein